MQITAYKCGYCGEIFEDERKWAAHKIIHREVEFINKLFPEPELKMGEFKKRTEEWYEHLKEMITKSAKTVHSNWLQKYKSVLSYGFMRSVDDSESPFYSLTYRLYKICNTCFREYDQPYFAINCKYCGKGENAKTPTNIKK